MLEHVITTKSRMRAVTRAFLTREARRVRDSNSATVTSTVYYYDEEGKICGEASQLAESRFESMWLNIFLATLLTFTMVSLMWGAWVALLNHFLLRRQAETWWREVCDLAAQFGRELDQFMRKHRISHPWAKRGGDRGLRKRMKRRMRKDMLGRTAMSDDDDGEQNGNGDTTPRRMTM